MAGAAAAAGEAKTTDPVAVPAVMAALPASGVAPAANSLDPGACRAAQAACPVSVAAPDTPKR